LQALQYESHSIDGGIEAEVVMEASVEWLCYSFSSLDYHTVLCFALNDVLPDYLTEAIYETFSVIFLSSISR